MDGTMPFGKHEGKPLTQVPRGYLRWLRDNANLSGWLKDAVEAVLLGRTVPVYSPDYTVQKTNEICQDGEWTFGRDEASTQ